MSEMELLNWPFCKEELEIVGKGHYFAHKTNNGCILQHLCFEIDDEEAVAAWNNRKPVEDVLERLGTLVEKCMNNSEKAAELGKQYEKHMIFNGAKGNAFEEAIEIIKGELLWLIWYCQFS